MDFQSKAQLILAQTYWLQGFPDRAVDTVLEGERFETPSDLSTCQALIIAMETFRLMRDWDALEERLDRLIRLAGEASLEPYGWLGMGFRGEVALRRGNVELGMNILRDAIARLEADRFEALPALAQVRPGGRAGHLRLRGPGPRPRAPGDQFHPGTGWSLLMCGIPADPRGSADRGRGRGLLPALDRHGEGTVCPVLATADDDELRPPEVGARTPGRGLYDAGRGAVGLHGGLPDGGSQGGKALAQATRRS